jgi:hypothetical protein
LFEKIVTAADNIITLKYRNMERLERLKEALMNEDEIPTKLAFPELEISLNLPDEAVSSTELHTTLTGHTVNNSILLF